MFALSAISFMDIRAPGPEVEGILLQGFVWEKTALFGSSFQRRKIKLEQPIPGLFGYCLLPKIMPY